MIAAPTKQSDLIPVQLLVECNANKNKVYKNIDLTTELANTRYERDVCKDKMHNIIVWAQEAKQRQK